MLGFFPTKKWPKQVFLNAPFLKIRNFFFGPSFLRDSRNSDIIASDSEKMYRASIGPFLATVAMEATSAIFILFSYVEELDVNRALNKSKILIHSHCNPRHITYITHIFILLLLLSVR